MAISRASRAWSGRPRSLNTPVEPVGDPDQLVARSVGGRVGPQLDQLAQRRGPVVVARSQPGHGGTADGLGELGVVGEQGHLGPDELGLGQELDQLGPRQGGAGLDQRAVGLADQSRTQQHPRPVQAHHAAFEIGAGLLDRRHQLQGPRQVARQELEQAEVVGAVERQRGQAVRLGQLERPGRVRLGRRDVPDQPVHLAPVQHDLALVDLGGVGQGRDGLVQLLPGFDQPALPQEHRPALTVDQDRQGRLTDVRGQAPGVGQRLLGGRGQAQLVLGERQAEQHPGGHQPPGRRLGVVRVRADQLAPFVQPQRGQRLLQQGHRLGQLADLAGRHPGRQQFPGPRQGARVRRPGRRMRSGGRRVCWAGFDQISSPPR